MYDIRTRMSYYILVLSTILGVLFRVRRSAEIIKTHRSYRSSDIVQSLRWGGFHRLKNEKSIVTWHWPWAFERRGTWGRVFIKIQRIDKTPLDVSSNLLLITITIGNNMIKPFSCTVYCIQETSVGYIFKIVTEMEKKSTNRKTARSIDITIKRF